jgi:signal transduction histidine kinase
VNRFEKIRQYLDERHTWMVLSLLFSLGQVAGNLYWIQFDLYPSTLFRGTAIAINFAVLVAGVFYLRNRSLSNLIVGLWRALLLFQTIVLFGIWDPYSRICMFLLMVLGIMLVEEFSTKRTFLSEVTMLLTLLAAALPRISFWHLHDVEPYSQQNLIPGVFLILAMTAGYRIRRSKYVVLLENEEKRTEQLNNILSLIMHNIRTPLTIMELEISMTKAIENRQINLDKLEELSNELLHTSTVMLAAEKESMLGKRNFLDIPINLPQHPYLIVDNQNTQEKFISRELYVVLSLALDNILSNAYTYAKSQVKVSFIVDTAMEISIVDDGPGMSTTQMESFGSTVVSSQHGMGMGLALSKKALSLFNWKMYIHRSDSNGTHIVLKEEIQPPF